MRLPRNSDWARLCRPDLLPARLPRLRSRRFLGRWTGLRRLCRRRSFLIVAYVVMGVFADVIAGRVVIIGHVHASDA